MCLYVLFNLYMYHLWYEINLYYYYYYYKALQSVIFQNLFIKAVTIVLGMWEHQIRL